MATGAVAQQRMTVKKAYARAGVDVDLWNRLKRGIQSLVRQTHDPQVLGKIGGFGIPFWEVEHAPKLRTNSAPWQALWS
jgi:phosphoribosylaminoimidazole (AIR) synthetase